MRTGYLALAAVVALAASPLHAQDKPAGPPAPAADKPAASPAEKKSPPVSAGPDGFSLQNEAADYRLQIRRYAHFDGRFFSGDESALAIHTFALRRVRPSRRGSDPPSSGRATSSARAPTSREKGWPKRS